ncbi:uncharacterized protein [Ptychodera flava]|uniref:uncharacterized protein n=1 Tax=Ptychodera flava TaxID=63121 RepID=UPI00396A150A
MATTRRHVLGDADVADIADPGASTNDNNGSSQQPLNESPATATVTLDDTHIVAEVPLLTDEQVTIDAPAETDDVEDLTRDSDSDDVTMLTANTQEHDSGSGIVELGSIGNSFEDLDDTLSLPVDLYSPMEFPDISLQRDTRVLVIHRSKMLEDMLNAFSDPGVLNDYIEVKLVLPNGDAEAASGTGVFRDCFTGFWADFYERCTIGNTYRVPYLRHDFTRAKWEAVGRIISKGWEQGNYLPIGLAPPFMQEVLFGMQDNLLESYLLFVSETEGDLFREALRDFQSVDKEELLEVLDGHQCKKDPSTANIRDIVIEIAHKELIQEPMFVIESWRAILRSVANTIGNMSLLDLYEEKKPTTRKVVKMLSFPDPISVEATTMANHLRRYIREVDGPTLKRFLRFCTGSDIMPDDPIKILFVNLEGIQRRPVAHTCSNLLELPLHYESYPDFRADFNAVLNSGVWLMDIV